MNTNHVTKKEYMENNNIIAASFTTLMTEFRSEMAEFRSEMTEFRSEMTEFKLEMTEFKLEMTEFKLEMTEFKLEMKSEIKAIHFRLDKIEEAVNDLTFEMGTMREELAAVTYRNIDLSDTVESHGMRITIIEDKIIV